MTAHNDGSKLRFRNWGAIRPLSCLRHIYYDDLQGPGLKKLAQGCTWARRNNRRLREAAISKFQMSPKNSLFKPFNAMRLAGKQ